MTPTGWSLLPVCHWVVRCGLTGGIIVTLFCWAVCVKAAEALAVRAGTEVPQQCGQLFLTSPVRSFDAPIHKWPLFSSERLRNDIITAW